MAPSTVSENGLRQGGNGVGEYRLVRFPPERNATLDWLRLARSRPQIPILLEVDVTEARSAVRGFRCRPGRQLGFTAYVVSCVARAAAEHPRVHSIRWGRRRVAIFDEVDVSVLVEKGIESSDASETLPMPFVVRDAARKRPDQIDDEIRRAQRSEVDSGSASIEYAGSGALQSLFFRLPRPVRDLFWWWLLRSPERIKRIMGTVVVTATGMASPGLLAWGIPSGLHPLAIGVGGIARRSTPDGDREILALTVVFDHGVTDGAPVGRFIRRLSELLGGAAGLEAAAEESERRDPVHAP